ncbi:cell division protein FtsW [Shewanella glacialipiscicola]|uniref:Probable peptidoglycan glycosyltransferase FtsW n=1 Tax=Shewanella glacialipiscicola TaxID=614069 RepID=A0ABQ6J763_9GAMM|nr:cell division protein FtsW [Shewanella glacialipiscicola]MCL1085645.1 cell division protein FtsW [Shewanella glacialipiscicola]MCU7996608.1 cell division protein FtsW [Shewanella glacialipiscicola]MCU8027921.1 cell division protein FtsW [Shewanella glacialipiscicola]GIU10328.1 putative lipid II flippase FtsW [Shewanella glacialipiscicola]GMA83587.1 putative lipid II flippase FtsW [Shewanella glacialipiscicola]
MASDVRQLSFLGRLRLAIPNWQRDTEVPGVQLYDRALLTAVLSLIGFGFVMVMSASMPEAQTLTGNPFYFMTRHMGYLVGCLVIAGFVLRVEMQTWQRWSPMLLLIVGLMLLAVLVVGTTVNGATRWLSLGPIRIQVAEVAKFAFAIYMAGYLVRRHQEVRENAKGFYKPIAVFAIYAVLILMQPDLGTVVVLFVGTVGLLFLAGARLLDFFALIFAGVLAFVALVLLEPYRMRRVTSFMDPWQDPFGSGYQLTQSLMAYGRGDWLGQGLGNSIQKLEYLPEAHTDFIFAVIGEELGFIGIIAVLFVLLFLALRSIRLGNLCLAMDKPFEGYLGYAIGIWICFQTVVNVGASIGMLPTKGLTLPFISYGGSSLWVMTAATMMLIRIDYERRMTLIQAVQGRLK